jgi:hypothetical protein
MTETTRLVSAITGELELLWTANSMSRTGREDLHGFKAEMDATLARALNDPDGFMASKIGQRRFATEAAPDRAGEPTPPPSSSAASIDGWAQAFAKASGQAPGGAT